MSNFQQEQQAFIDNYGGVRLIRVHNKWDIEIKTHEDHNIRLGTWRSIIFYLYLTLQNFIDIRKAKMIMRSNARKERKHE